MYKILIRIIIFGFCFFSLSSCGKFDDDWKSTKNGVKIYNKTETLFGGDYSWTGDTLYMGVANGKGVLSFEDNINKKNNYKKSTILYYGSVVKPADPNNFIVGDIDKNGKLNGFGVLASNGEIIISSFKKSKAKGEGVIYQNNNIKYLGILKNSRPNGMGKLYYSNGKIKYNGEFEKGAFDGLGKLYNEDGTIVYDGKFKNGKYNGDGKLYYGDGMLLYQGGFKNGLYNGYGILTDTVNGSKVAHVWTAGALDKTTAKVYQKLEQNRASYNSVQYAKTVNRYLVWERYHAWMYAGWAILAVLVLLIGIDQLEEDPLTRYDRSSRWKKKHLWAVWLLFGWTGVHRFLLRSKVGVIFTALFSALICLQMRNLSLYLFYPSTWNMWETNVATNIILALMASFLVIDFFYIPIRCYNLNREYYRHDKNERLLVKKISSPLVQFGESLPTEVSVVRKRINGCLTTVKSIQANEFKGKKGFFTKVGRAISGNDPWLDHELMRCRKLQDVLEDTATIQDKYSELCDRLNHSLEESRNNAYRNLKLAKELIALAVPSKSKRQRLIKDAELTIKKKQTQDLSIERIESISVGVDWNKTIDKSIMSSMTLIKMGVKGPWAIGIAALASVVEGIGEAMERADKARLECEKACAKAVNNLSDAASSILQAEASVLRYSEVIVALNKSNAIFWQTYAPLRDQIFSKKFSIREFFIGPRVDRSLIERLEFKNDIMYLAVICAEYNKINQSKVN